jgi:hypothetical protein
MAVTLAREASGVNLVPPPQAYKSRISNLEARISKVEPRSLLVLFLLSFYNLEFSYPEACSDFETWGYGQRITD